MLFAFVLSNPSGHLLLQLLAAGGCGLWLVLPPPRHTTTTTASSFFPRMAVAQRAIALEMTCATVPHRIWIAFLGKCRRYGDCSGVGVLNCSASGRPRKPKWIGIGGWLVVLPACLIRIRIS